MRMAGIDREVGAVHAIAVDAVVHADGAVVFGHAPAIRRGMFERERSPLPSVARTSNTFLTNSCNA